MKTKGSKMIKAVFSLVFLIGGCIGCEQTPQDLNTFYHYYAGHGIDEGLEEYLVNYPYALPKELNIVRAGYKKGNTLAQARGEPDGSYCEITVFDTFSDLPEYSKHIIMAHELEHCRQVSHDNEYMPDGKGGFYKFYKLSLMHETALNGLNMRLLLQDQSWKDEITEIMLESQYDAIMEDDWTQTLCSYYPICRPN